MTAGPTRRPGQGETPAQRRARLDAIFGDTLPDTTRDEREPDAGGEEQDGGEAWLRAQVPPHHGS